MPIPDGIGGVGWPMLSSLRLGEAFDCFFFAWGLEGLLESGLTKSLILNPEDCFAISVSCVPDVHHCGSGARGKVTSCG
jgi:hypothetical protein